MIATLSRSIELVANIRAFQRDFKPKTNRFLVFPNGRILAYDTLQQQFTSVHCVSEADSYHLRQIADVLLRQKTTV